MMRRCLGPNCPTLIPTGSRCPRCEVANRGTRQQRQSFRAAVLSRDGYTCQSCGLVDPSGKQLEADHVTALADGGNPLDIGNGSTLCKADHRAKTLGRIK